MNAEEYKLPLGQKASLVSIVCEKFENHSSALETNASLKELRELLRTLGVIAGEEYVQNKKQIDPSTMLGEGKLQEIAEAAREEGSNLLVFDFELTASQTRNIKEITKLEIVDRNTVILEIFAHHARTKEAKIQIEISRLQYLLPRLTSMWGHFSKQRGGGRAVGGEGEQQLELDRRMVRERIEYFKRQLDEVQRSREQQRKRRQNQAVTAALVGYTNAGKSSLMNRLCKVNVLEENKLFAFQCERKERRELKKTESQIPETNEEEICCICLDELKICEIDSGDYDENEKNVLLNPCGHSLCAKCNFDLKNSNEDIICPLCRTQII